MLFCKMVLTVYLSCVFKAAVLETPYLLFKHDLELLNRLFRLSCILIGLTLYNMNLSSAFHSLGWYISISAGHNRASVSLCSQETCRRLASNRDPQFLAFQLCCGEDKRLKRGNVKLSELKDYCIREKLEKSNVHLGSRVERILFSQIQRKNRIISVPWPVKLTKAEEC